MLLKRPISHAKAMVNKRGLKYSRRLKRSINTIELCRKKHKTYLFFFFWTVLGLKVVRNAKESTKTYLTHF